MPAGHYRLFGGECFFGAGLEFGRSWLGWVAYLGWNTARGGWVVVASFGLAFLSTRPFAYDI